MKTNIMDRFLAQTLGITDRGLRKIKIENPFRYQREMMGALVLASMSPNSFLDSGEFNAILGYFNTNTDLLVLDSLARKKVHTLNALADFASFDTKEDLCRRSFSIRTANYIEAMLSAYFTGYYGDNDENFEFSFEDWHGENIEDKMKYGRVLPILTVSTVDIFCGQFDSIRKEKIDLCVSAENGENRILTISEIIEKISDLFPEIKKRTIPTYEQHFNLEFASHHDSSPKKPLCSVATELPNGWKLHVEPLIVYPVLDVINEMIVPTAYIMLKGEREEHLNKYILTPSSKEEEDRNIEILHTMCKKVGLKNDENVKKMFKIIEKKRSKEWMEKNKDNDDDAMFHIVRLEDYIFDHIS